jgi:alpha/beta hydrolase family protein
MPVRQQNLPFRTTSEFNRRALLGLSIATAMSAAAMLVAAPVADARTTKLQITSRTIAFGGYSFAGVGQYEKIVGTAFGEIDPNDPKNAVITDIALAPRNANGKVEYSHNFYILKPLDLSKGNHKMMYEPPNRGGKTHGTLNRGAGGNDPGAVTDPDVLANTFLWPRGYTTVWSGWEDLAPLTSLTATLALPIAHNADGSPITGPAYEYIVTSGNNFALTYPAASLSQAPADAQLTHRVHLDDPPVVVPATGWAYTDATGKAIKLIPGPFVQNDIYEFSYTAKDPKVAGVGFAAVRDFNSFLRYATVDDFGTANPLAGDVTRIYTEISSQPGRLLNDFRHLGFNEDESGKKVFDGLMQWVAAGDGINMNYRWSQSGRTERNRQDHLYLEGLFPFANQTTFDPISGTTDGRYKKCEVTNTCPLAMEFYSSNEYWVKPASLFHTDPMGTVDLPDHPLARLYLLSSKQHGGAGNPTSKGACQQFLNPLDSAPVQRALWEDLDQWSTKGTEPPPSQVPKLSDRTMVPPLPQSGVGFPNIPGVTYTGLQTTRYRFNYGPNFYATGIPTINPPVITPPYQGNPLNGPIYPSYVPTTDSDGNEIAGIRLPELVAPLATYTGWALRSGVWANDGCEGSGQYIPFAKTTAQRIASGDPRPSVEERYPSFGQYYSAVIRAIDGLVKDRFLLCEDTEDMQARLLQAGLDAGVPAPKGKLPPQTQVPSCQVAAK